MIVPAISIAARPPVANQQYEQMQCASFKSLTDSNTHKQRQSSWEQIRSQILVALASCQVAIASSQLPVGDQLLPDAGALGVNQDLIALSTSKF